MKHLLLLLLLFIVINTQAQSPIFTAEGLATTDVWCDSTGYYFDVLFNDNGSYYMVGIDTTDQKSISTNANRQALVTYRNTNHEIVWRKTYGGSKLDRFYKIFRIAPDRLMLVGESNSADGDVSMGYIGGSNIWAAVIDTGGTLIHSQIWGYGNASNVHDAAITSDGKLFIVGSTIAKLGDFAVNTSAFLEDVTFIIHADSQLNKKWLKMPYNKQSVFKLQCEILSNDVLLISNPCWDTTGVYQIGTTLGTPDQIYLYMDTNGNYVKKHRVGSSGLEVAELVAINSNDKIYSLVASDTKNGPYFVPSEFPSFTSPNVDYHCLAVSDTNGNILSKHLLGSFDPDSLRFYNPGFLYRDMAIANNSIWAIGYVTGKDKHCIGEPFLYTTLDAWLVQFDTTGLLKRKARIGGTFYEIGHIVRGSPQGKIYGGIVSYFASGSQYPNAFSCYQTKRDLFKWQEIHIWPTAVTNIPFNELGLALYPNPAQSFITIQFQNPTNEKMLVEVFDASGKRLQKRSVASNTYELQTQTLPNGSYFVRVSNSKGATCKPFVVNH